MGALPETVRASGATTARDLDVRPVLDSGGDPFSLIMKTVRALGPTEALHLIVGFEPKPLYSVLGSQGFSAHAEREGDAFHVWFTRTAANAEPAAAPAHRDELQPPVAMDVRGLVPPEPMLQILEKLVELGPGAQLLVSHHREPVLLYEKLALRGYGAKTTKRGEGDFLVHIAPAWVFQAA